ncbi:MAG: hypothetical protein QOE61_4006 [Micromonosporaceae bacterium]|jgi:hypothetical protein|nr:hypothetical protein [Micromonosporaceae bacterium]
MLVACPDYLADVFAQLRTSLPRQQLSLWGASGWHAKHHTRRPDVAYDTDQSLVYTNERDRPAKATPMEEDDRDASPPRDHDVSATKKRGRRPSEPLKVRLELVVVDGEAGRELMQRQAAVVREALQWFADNPPTTSRAMGDAVSLSTTSV